MIVNDDEDSLFLLDHALRHEFAEACVVLFHDGASALAAVRLERPDAIVTDNRMPHMTGLELVAAIRRFDLELPIMMLTAAEDQAAAASGAGVTAFCSECSMVEIGRAVREMFTRTRGSTSPSDAAAGK